MAVYKCPSCGARYNGKRCRSCLYEHFTEEIAHGNHTHEGEPLVIEAPVRKPIRRKNPFACDTRTRKKKSARPLSIAVLMILLSVIGPILEGVFTVVEEVSDAFSFIAPEPEPDIVFPEQGTILYAGEGLEVVTSWLDDQSIPDTIPVYVRNETGDNLVLAVRDVILNDCMSGGTYLHCEIRDGRTATTNLRLSRSDMERAGITTVNQLRFCLDVMEKDSYKTLLYSDPITLAPQNSGPNTDVIPQGTLLYGDENITISCLGYARDEYHPEEVWEGTILFHLENHTDRRLEVWTPEITLNGEESDLNLWSELCPNTRTVAIMYLHSLEELEAVTPEELIRSVEVCFSFSDSENYESVLTTDALSLSGNQ